MTSFNDNDGNDETKDGNNDIYDTRSQGTDRALTCWKGDGLWWEHICIKARNH